MGITTSRADIGRRVYHTTTRRYGTLETVGGVMADVRFSCGRLQLCSKGNLRWADDPDNSWLDACDAAMDLAGMCFTDADQNQPDTSIDTESDFSGEGGSFGGGGASGDW